MYNNVLVPVSFDTERDGAGALAVAKHLAGENGRIALLGVSWRVIKPARTSRRNDTP